MRKLSSITCLLMGFSVLLAGCATSPADVFEHNSKTWIGATDAQLQEQWGVAPYQIREDDGAAIYTYYARGNPMTEGAIPFTARGGDRNSYNQLPKNFNCAVSFKIIHGVVTQVRDFEKSCPREQ